jgi:hypothetical protein
MRKRTGEARPTWAGHIPLLKPGQYSDGLPFHEIQYLCCKLVLKPNRFCSRQSMFDFARILRGPAGKHDVKFLIGTLESAPIQIREVLFVDTSDFRLYNNGFILRRRIQYEEGFPIGDPEIVFKYRDPDLQKAAETDVRPQILGDYRVKFKCQALPLRHQLGGLRMLYSHNVQFPRSSVSEKDVFSMGTLTKIFPVLASIRNEPGEQITLVSNTIVEEVLQDIGVLHLGQGIRAHVNVALWRTSGEHRPLIGELAFQLRFKDRRELGLHAMKRLEAFFVALQYAAQDWIALDATKTGVVYRLHGNAPTPHE